MSQGLKRKKSLFKKSNMFPVFALALSMGGFALFYFLPFVISSAYAFTENPLQMKFAGFHNFIDLFHNRYFLLGLKNTVVFMAFAIPLSIISSLLLSLALKEFKRLGNLFSIIFLIPLMLPSASTVQFWVHIFSDQGVINHFLRQLGIAGPSWLSNDYIMGVMIFIYVWKNLGYNAVLFLTGLYGIPEVYYNCASVYGANMWQRFCHVTLVYLTPSFFLVFIMSFVNSFKIFREVYLIQGDYPSEKIYLLQHFVNSTLLSLHYQKLVSAVYVLTVLVALVVLAVFQFERRFSRNLSD